MKRYLSQRVLDCETDEASYYCCSATTELGWEIVESGEWGMICATPRTQSASLCKFEITWRHEGNKTRLSIYGPLATVQTTSVDPARLVGQLEQDILARMQERVVA